MGGRLCFHRASPSSVVMLGPVLPLASCPLQPPSLHTRWPYRAHRADRCLFLVFQAIAPLLENNHPPPDLCEFFCKVGEAAAGSVTCTAGWLCLLRVSDADGGHTGHLFSGPHLQTGARTHRVAAQGLGKHPGCLWKPFQPVSWILDVRAGLFLAEAPPSTSWPTVGARPRGFP